MAANDAFADEESPTTANAQLQTGAPPSKKARFINADDVKAKQRCNDHDDLLNALPSELRNDVNAIFDAKQILFIEVCAGSAVLSACAKRRGYRVMPVDYKRNRHQPKCQVVQ